MHLLAGALSRADQGQEDAHVVTKNKDALREFAHLVGCSHKFLAAIHDEVSSGRYARFQQYSTALKELLVRFG